MIPFFQNASSSFKVHIPQNSKLLEMIPLGLLLVIVLMTMRVVGDTEEHLVVETSVGKVLGERVVSDTGKELDIWSSIPFAEPPVGNLR